MRQPGAERHPIRTIAIGAGLVGLCWGVGEIFPADKPAEVSQLVPIGHEGSGLYNHAQESILKLGDRCLRLKGWPARQIGNVVIRPFTHDPTKVKRLEAGQNGCAVGLGADGRPKGVSAVRDGKSYGIYTAPFEGGQSNINWGYGPAPHSKEDRNSWGAVTLNGMTNGEDFSGLERTPQQLLSTVDGNISVTIHKQELLETAAPTSRP